MCKPVDFRYAGDRQCRVLSVGQRSQRGDVDPVVSCEPDWCLHNRVGWGYGARSESLDHAIVAVPALELVWNLAYEVVAWTGGKNCARGWLGEGEINAKDLVCGVF